MIAVWTLIIQIVSSFIHLVCITHKMHKSLLSKSFSISNLRILVALTSAGRMMSAIPVIEKFPKVNVILGTMTYGSQTDKGGAAG